jgi:hypothetical protein
MSSDNKDNKPDDKVRQQQDAAANVLRRKLVLLYDSEPEAGEELAKVKELKKYSGLSKHQKYMDGLSKSGRSLADIQRAWHEYYQKLPDNEKHEVWQEFYALHAKIRCHVVKQQTKNVVVKVEKEHKEREEEY